MSRKQPSSSSRTPLIALSATGLAVGALAVGFWLGGAGGAQPTTAGRADAPAPAQARVAQPAAADAGVQKAADSAMTETAAEPRAGGMAGHSPPGDANRAAPDAAQGAQEADADAAGADADDTRADAESKDVAEAIDPADLYAPQFTDHEPEALTAIEEGRMGQPAVVMFHADWCHVCQEVMPEVYDLRERYRGELAVLKVNIDHQHPAMARYPVRGTPTFVFFDRNGMSVKTQGGWPGEPLMAQYMDMALAIQ